MDITNLVHDMALKARAAARQVGNLSRTVKDKVICRVAGLLEERRAALQAENRRDLEAAAAQNYPTAFIDRLTMSDKVIDSMIKGLLEVAALPDPVGAVTGMWVRPNGLKVGRQRIPLGVIGFIYESRPNVTVDAAALCLKSGNAVILKGGKEAIHSNLALAELMQEALAEAGAPQASVQVIPSIAREATLELLKQDELVDLIIPRGGESLIRFVAEHSRIPVLKHYQGICHIFVDDGADLDMAKKVCFNAKVQRPGVCNAMETMLVHQETATTFLPRMLPRFREAGVEIRGCPCTLKLVPWVVPATDADWGFEFLDLILAVKVVPDLDAALDHIARYSTKHTEAIITRDYGRAQRFLKEVDSSVVLVNASTRFNDGGELGLGAEIGINTSKLHAFGPMGLEELTTTKFIVYGDGQIRTEGLPRLGLFGGTFNPIHFGHLRAAEEVCEALSLRRLWFIPAGEPPHKGARDLTSFAVRLEMTRLAVGDHPRMEVSDIEGRRAGKSYSIETLRLLREQFGPAWELYFILGLDAMLEIPTWKDYHQLFQLCHFVVLDRPGYDRCHLEEVLQRQGPPQFAALPGEAGFQHPSGNKILWQQTTLMDISATGIRGLVRQGRSIRYLLPEPVREYIINHNLYR